MIVMTPDSTSYRSDVEVERAKSLPSLLVVDDDDSVVVVVVVLAAGLRRSLVRSPLDGGSADD